MNTCLECGALANRKFCSPSCSNKYHGRKRYEENQLSGQHKCCSTCGETLPIARFSYQVRGNPSSGRRDYCKSCGRGEIVKARRARNWTHKAAHVLYRNSLQRAKRSGLEHTLTLSDIHIPDTCPVLGIPLFREGRDSWMNAPSLDRIDNEKGYTKENVIVVSRRANILKKDAKINELVLMAKFYSQYLES